MLAEGRPLLLLLLAGVTVLIATIEGVVLSGSRGYDWRGYWSSLGDLALRQLSRLMPLGFGLALLELCYRHRVATLTPDSAWTLALLFLAVEFTYYWMHRADHAIRWLWATHSVHHSPTELTFASALRLGFTQQLSGVAILFAPLVLLGFEPQSVLATMALNLFYQFWLHNDWMPSWGPLEWVLNTPSHHRVHHANNAPYVDRNFGGVLIVFDRLFGTFQARLEAVPPVYGLDEPIGGHNPLRIGLHAWVAIARDARHSDGPRALFRTLFGAPTRSRASAGFNATPGNIR